MSTIPAQYRSTALPQVDLMPPEVGQRRDRSRRRSIVVLLFVGFILLLAVAYVGVAYVSQQAQAEAATETEKTAALQAEIAALSEVDVVKAKLANSESARQYAAGVEMFWPLVLAAIDGALPEDALIQAIDVSAVPFGASPPYASDVLGVAGVASITLTLQVPSHLTSVTVEDSLNNVPFFTRARATQVWVVVAAGEGEGIPAGTVPQHEMEVTFTVTYDGLMMRFSPRWFGTDEQGESLEEYYQDYVETLLAGGTVTQYPPLPEVTPPPFVPGQQSTAPDPAAPAPSPSPSPSVEGEAVE